MAQVGEYTEKIHGQLIKRLKKSEKDFFQKGHRFLGAAPKGLLSLFSQPTGWALFLCVRAPRIGPYFFASAPRIRPFCFCPPYFFMSTSDWALFLYVHLWLALISLCPPLIRPYFFMPTSDWTIFLAYAPLIGPFSFLSLIGLIPLCLPRKALFLFICL